MKTGKGEPDWLKVARAEGRIIEGGVRLAETVLAEVDDSPLVEPTFRGSTLFPVWELPIRTKSEINHREWRKRSKRTDEAWRVVSRYISPQMWYLVRFIDDYHRSSKPIGVRFTRLGGRKLDRGNLPTALKATEDALAFIMGADDGDNRWQSEFEQEPGGPVGVRIELFIPKEVK